MKLDSIVQASRPTNLVVDKPVGPTLMIGLGGTGKEVLLRLRRKIVERYGSLNRLPFIKFMHLDTDTTATAHEQYDIRAASDPLHEEIRFTPAERVSLTIQGGTGRYIQHLGNFPHIKRWLAAWGKIADLGDLGQGAGQIRMASRLGFFDADNFARIVSRLEQCKAQLQDVHILEQTGKLGFDFSGETTHIVIVASIAGGTGSGTFLDMAFLAKRYFANADQVGILLLPSFFSAYAGGQRVRANGYAALMELNHYTFGHSFVTDWTSGGDNTSLPPPPFSNTYLIDGENEARLTIASGGKEYDAYRMVAEALFQEYSVGPFAGMKRATRVNLANYNLNIYTHNFLSDALRKSSGDRQKNIVGDTYPTRFGSFGVSMIAFPTDRVQSACASRLAARVLAHWQKSAVEDPLERLFTTFVSDDDVQFAQGRYERRDTGGVIEARDIENALMVFESGGGKTFASHLWQKAQTVRNDLQATPNGLKAVRLAEHRAELERFLAKEDSVDPREWGVGIRQIENNMRAYVARVKAGIEKKAAELADDAHFGVNYTLSLLRELKSLLHNENFWYVAEFERQIPSWRDAVQYYGNELDQLQMDIARHERERLFRAEDLKRDYQKLVADDPADEDLGAFYNHYLARVRKQVAKRAKQVCEEILRFLGPDTPAGEGLLGRYYDLLVGFQKLDQRLRDKERYFSNDEKSALVLSLLRDGDVDEWYRTWVGEPENENDVLETLGNEILRSIFHVDTVTAALAHIQRTPAETVEAEILDRCRAWIASHRKQPDALAMLFDANRVSVREREDMVKTAYRLGKVWLAPATRGLEHTELPNVHPDQRPCLIGVDTSNIPRLEQFKSLIGDKVQVSGETQPSYLNIGEHHRGMIVFYNELAGVPAFYPSSVTAPGGLRAAYNAHPEKEELHTDKNRFQFGDLMPKETAEAARYAESLRAFVLARVLGLLAVRQVDGDSEYPSFHYSYTREDVMTETVFLGDESHAVDYLYREQERDHLAHRRILLQMVDETIGKLRTQGLMHVYGLLIEFYLQKIYRPQDVAGLDALHITAKRYSPEYAVLHEARRTLEASVVQANEREQFKNHVLRTTGKKLGDAMTWPEFHAVLKDYCTTAGRYAEQSTDEMNVSKKLEWLDVLALDPRKLDKTPEKDRIKPISRPAAAVAMPDRRFGERPCPNCRKPIDRRAVFCTECQQMVAQAIACPHCEEQRVPDDLEFCWKCGQKLRNEEQVDCPRCFSWRGYEEQFPCPNCGFDPRIQDPGPGPVGATRLTVTAPSAEMPVADMPSAAIAASEPEIAESVQCPLCYSLVPPGTQCAVCDGVLEMR